MLAPVQSAVLVRLPVKNLPAVLLSSYKLTWGEGLQVPECLPWAHTPEVKYRCKAFWGVISWLSALSLASTCRRRLFGKLHPKPHFHFFPP